MSRIAVWNPWQEMHHVTRNLDQLLNGDWWPAGQRTAEFPLINAWQKNDTLTVTAELPGMDPAQLDLAIEKNTLTLSGKRQAEEVELEENYVRRERWFKEFKRTVELPFDVDTEKCEATYEKGVLTITLHRAAQAEPKKLTVKAS